MPAPRRSSQTELFEEVQAVALPPLPPPIREHVLQQMVQWMQAVAVAVAVDEVNEVNQEAGREQQDHR